MTQKPPSVNELLMVFVMLYQDKGADAAIESLGSTLFRYGTEMPFHELSDLFKEVLIRAMVFLTDGYVTMSAYYLKLNRSTLYYMINRINNAITEDKNKIVVLPRSWDGRHDVRKCGKCNELFIGTAANSCPFCRERERIKLYDGRHRANSGAKETYGTPWRDAARASAAKRKLKSKAKNAV